MPRHSALRCVSSIRQNNAKPLISNGLRFVVTCLLTAALWVLFHVARHTWASVAKRKNIPISIISEGMGHHSETTTQIYLASLNSTIIDEANAQILKELR